MLWIWTFLTYVNVCPNHCWLSACKRSNSKLLSFQPFLKFRSLSHFPYFLHSLSINLNFLSLHKITAAWACSFLTTSFYFINVSFSCSYETFPMYPSLSYLLLFLHDYIGKKKKKNWIVLWIWVQISSVARGKLLLSINKTYEPQSQQRLQPAREQWRVWFNFKICHAEIFAVLFPYLLEQLTLLNP